MAATRSTIVFLTMFAVFGGLTRPSFAQSIESPLARAIREHTSRMSLETRSDRADAGWPRVRTLTPGTDVTLTTRGSQAAVRLFVAAVDSGLTVLNLSDTTLSAAASRTLRQIASQHPDYFAAAVRGGTFVIDGMHLSSVGLSVNGNTIADLPRVLETDGRDEVVEISVRRRGRGFWGHLGPLGGYFVGAMAGGLAVGKVCQAINGTDRCDTGAFLGGSFFGGIAGGTYGFVAARRTSEVIVYHAP